jgi:hypothetical protein
MKINCLRKYKQYLGETGAAAAQSHIFPHIETPSEDIDGFFSL